MTIDSNWIGIALTAGVYLVTTGIFVGIVRTSMRALTHAFEKLETRMDAFERGEVAGVGSAADIAARVKALEDHRDRDRALRDIVIEQGTRQTLQHDALQRSVTALEHRVEAAVAMIANQARRSPKGEA